ncbi:hypothetical protein BC835DRAFT_1309614, partial [Cytidiella melzeri]
MVNSTHSSPRISKRFTAPDQPLLQGPMQGPSQEPADKVDNVVSLGEGAVAPAENIQPQPTAGQEAHQAHQALASVEESSSNDAVPEVKNSSGSDSNENSPFPTRYASQEPDENDLYNTAHDEMMVDVIGVDSATEAVPQPLIHEQCLHRLDEDSRTQLSLLKQLLEHATVITKPKLRTALYKTMLNHAAHHRN